MEHALRALRQLSAGVGNEAWVFKAASLVPAGWEETTTSTSAELVRQGSDSESEEEILDIQQQSVKLSELYTWGRATNYQLGYGVSGNEQQIPKLVQLPIGKQVMYLSCGRFHSTAVTSCGSVFTWGFAGASGRLGLEQAKREAREAAVVEPTPLPQFGPGRHHATKVATGLNHTLAMTAAGKLLVWGSNERGQLGHGTPGDTAVLQPTVLKAAPWQKQKVTDIATGSLHSLCIAGESGQVFAWGCNAHGALGLGTPPTGPSHTAQPQCLPHLKSATFLVANPSGNVSLCLMMSHGDAMMFGGSPVPASDGRSVDQRFYVPARVRRKEPDPSLTSSDDWQLQRGSQLSPLRWATLSDSEGFGIDTDGLLWVWPTSSRPATADLVSVALKRAVRSRLASASGANELTLDPSDPSNNEFVLMEEGEDEELTLATQELLMPKSPMQAPNLNEVQQVGISNFGVSFKAGISWAVDDSAGHLWQLKRAKSKDGWAAERFEYLAQVSCFACGPEHQAAVTTYTVPTVPRYDLPQDLKAVKAQESQEQHGDETDTRSDSKETVAKRPVQSLQQICEDKLCAKLNPRSFGLVCDIAWELNRPALLDRAFRFLCANAPLMFSKLHLPTLSQLPVEVLAAFEMAAKAKVVADSGGASVGSAPSRKESREDVVQMHETNDLPFVRDFGDEFSSDLGAPFQMDDMDDERMLNEISKLCESGQWSSIASQALSLLATSLPGSAAGEGLIAEKLGLSFALDELEQVQLEADAEKEDARRKRRASNVSSVSPQIAAVPSKYASPAMSSKSSPKSAAISPFLQPEKSSSPMLEAQDRQEWVEVKGNSRARKDVSMASPKVKASPEPTQMPPAAVPPSPKGGKKGDSSGKGGKDGKGKGKTSLMSLDESASSRHLRLADFIKPQVGRGKGKGGTDAKKSEKSDAESGPSAILVSALQSAGKAEKGVENGSAKWALPKDDGCNGNPKLSQILEEDKGSKEAKRKQSLRKPETKVMTCSWGRDALPSEQSKNQSIAEIQQEEELLREHDEILEIEAMFAALEVAEIHEALEQSRAANGEVTGPSPSKDVKGRASGHKPQAKVEAKGHRKKKGNPNSKSDWWSQGWDGWNSGWWESEKSTARWQKRPAESETAQREA